MEWNGIEELKESLPTSCTHDLHKSLQKTNLIFFSSLFCGLWNARTRRTKKGCLSPRFWNFLYKLKLLLTIELLTQWRFEFCSSSSYILYCLCLIFFHHKKQMINDFYKSKEKERKTKRESERERGRKKASFSSISFEEDFLTFFFFFLFFFFFGVVALPSYKEIIMIYFTQMMQEWKKLFLVSVLVSIVFFSLLSSLLFPFLVP